MCCSCHDLSSWDLWEDLFHIVRLASENVELDDEVRMQCSCVDQEPKLLLVITDDCIGLYDHFPYENASIYWLQLKILSDK